MKIIIVGGVAGGASCATRLRRLNENLEITIYEKNKYISYANCGMPYFIGNVVEKNRLILNTKEKFQDKYNIKVNVNSEVIDVNTSEKYVVIKDLIKDVTYKDSYDKLILSTGSVPKIPKIEGINSNKVFTLRYLEDSFKIKDYIDNNNIKSVSIIGAGFIGLEMAENLKNIGIEVNVIEMSDHIMNTLDFDMAKILEKYMIKKGINIYTNSEVLGFIEVNNKIITNVSSNQKFNSDMVIFSIGVAPNTVLANKVGLKLGLKNAIVVDDYMQTSIKDIYAVGDCIEVQRMSTNSKCVIELAGPAHKEARIAADHICGINHKYRGSLGSAIMKMFDMAVATTGLNEHEAEKLNLDYDYAVVQAPTHAMYYPNSSTLIIKALFEKETGLILGSQVIGYDKVDKITDVIATAILNKMTCFDLADLDLSYSPPFSLSTNPVNTLGYVIEGIVDKSVYQKHWADLKKLSENEVIIDVRTIEEYNDSHYPNSINIPVKSLRSRLKELDKNKTYYVYCRSGSRSYAACRILLNNSYKAFNITEGFQFYQLVNK